MTPHEWDAAAVGAVIALIAVFCLGWQWPRRHTTAVMAAARGGEMCQDCYDWCAPCRCCLDDLAEFDAGLRLDPPDMTGYEPFVATSGERNVHDLPALAPSTGSQGGEYHERVWADQMRHDLAPEHIQDLPGPQNVAQAHGVRAGEPQLAYTLDPESLWQLRRMTLMGPDRERWAASMGFAVTDSGDLAVAA